MPLMTPIALFAPMVRSTNRSKPDGAIAGYRLQNVSADRGFMCQGYSRRAT
jgi:hypothetical protein